MKLLCLFIFLVSNHGMSNQPESIVTKNSQILELNLKIAKLWTRIDELEIRLQKQAEHINLLEQGLTLGIIPQGLNKSRPIEVSRPNSPDDENDNLPHKKKMLKKPTIMSRASYSKLVRLAQSSFSEQNYGKAISVYKSIQQDYPQFNSEGQSYYWIGLSWFYLKEFQNAHDSFVILTNDYPHSSWIGSSKLHIAKISKIQKHHKKAIEIYQEIIESYPNTDLANMARHDLDQLEENI